MHIHTCVDISSNDMSFLGSSKLSSMSTASCRQKTSYGTKGENLSEQQIYTFMANELNLYAQC